MENKVSIAPMMDWTDRHCRYFLRLLSPSARLYTEMVTAAAVRHGDREKLLAYHPDEHPLALQLGGSDPSMMAEAAEVAAGFGYDEININVGCPSDRVQSGQFGACLMARPDIVADCFDAMQAKVDVPVTVKTRIGIDDQDSEAFLWQFVEALVAAGCRKFIVHARIAILDGLSPKENRDVPPLNYERVYRLKAAYPSLEIVLNGGIKTVDDVDRALKQVDGAMIGRQAYHHPYLIAELEKHFDPDFQLPNRTELVERMLSYIDVELANGEKLGRITRHMLGLFSGQPGARSWRRNLSEHAWKSGAGTDVLLRALQTVPSAG